jgi:polysaccharide pyruvyl transferase WcaK-like protein
MDQFFHSPRRVSLLTPYTGGNLGDAAVQEALIRRIRRDYPTADIALISLCPHITGRLHKAVGIPLDQFAKERCPTDGLGSPEPSSRPPEGLPRGVSARLKSHLRSIYALRRTIRLLRRLLRRLKRTLLFVPKEVAHVRRALNSLHGFDLIIVAGGGQIDDFWGGPWQQPYSLLKWGVLAKLVGARYAIASVGVGSLNSRSGRFFFRRALKLADYRSYRDTVSREKLAFMGFTRSDAVYPDLAFSFPATNAPRRAPTGRGGPLSIGISPIAYMVPGIWPIADIRTHEQYFEVLAAFAEDVLGAGHSVTVFSTASQDHSLVHRLAERLRASRSETSVRSVTPQTIDALTEELQTVDCVVASRLHGVVIPHALHIPVLALAYNWKVDVHMKTLAQQRFCLDINALYTGSLDRAFARLVDESEKVMSTLREAGDRYREQLERQYELLLRGNYERKTYALR